MSRSQETQVLDTANANSSADQTAAEKAQAAETTDIGNYETQLAKFAAGNPYTAGGEYQTAQNQTLAGTADAGSAALTDQLQTQAQRTGQNAAGANATAAENAREAQRTLSAEEGSTNDTRIGDEAGYNQTTLNATAVPAQIEQGIYGTGVAGANGALNTAQSAAQTPGFWDTLGDSFAKSLGETAGGGNGSGAAAIMKYCWIAAELYGGWFEPRTVAVRQWLATEFAARWYGPPLLWLYGVGGEWMAGCIRRRPWLRRVFLPIFNRALANARRG